MNKIIKQTLSLILALVLILGLLPAAAFASGSADRFADVGDHEWFAEAVQYVSDNGLMVGVSETSFAPDNLTTRAMVVTVLHRMEGTPEAAAGGFTDVAEGAWYTKAIDWAQANGIVQGYGDGTFHPDADMTREEMVAVFYRYSQYKNYDVKGIKTLTVFRDSAQIQSYAQDAMGWGVGVGLIQGFPDGTIRPQAQSNRAQLATVLMRFAQINAIPDDGNDEEDEVITSEDVAALTASRTEVLADTATDVKFYVNSTLTVSGFELYRNGQSTGVWLYDNGNYAGNGDDIPNDGCYTGVYRIDHQQEEDVIFTARATVGGTAVTTNERSVFVYYELTDAQIDQMDAIEAGVSAIASSAWANAGSGGDETVIARIRTDVEAYLAPYISSGVVSDLEYHAECFAYSWNYPQIGVDTMVQIGRAEAADPDIKREGGLRGQLVTGVGTDSPAAGTAAVDLDVSYSVGKAVILNYYGPTHAWSVAYDAIGQKLEDAGFDVTYIYDFTCSDFMFLEEYDSMILVNSHGNTYWGGQGSKPMICTEEKQTKARNKTYSADLKKNRIEKVTLDTGEKVYWIAPKLFTDYYADTPLSSPIVHLGLCRGYPENNNKLVDAMVDVGASAVCGYDASVSTSYDTPMADSIVERLVAGDTIEEALTWAQDAHGDEDPWKDTDWLWNRNAELKLYGNEGAVLYHKLSNGKFDNSFGLLFDGVFGWREYGDARSIFRLAGLEAVSAPRMAIISSGFGSMGGETTSSIYQTFLVPGDANSIEFHYNVVSEEPMEYVGSSYNDIFQVELLDTDGKVLETLAYESVNTSTWHAIEGIDFPGGDHSAYHTRWHKVTSSALEKYRGKLVVIRFVVQDAGDSQYDTAALIDSVVVK